MLGRNHVLVGAVGWVAVGVPLLRLAGYEMTAQEALVGTLVASGAALLPDIDHPDSTVAHTLGPITEGIAWVTAKVTGGHRHETHSILFCLAAGAGTGLVTAHLGRWAVFAVLWFCGSWALRLIAEQRHGLLAPVTAGVAAWWLSTFVTGGLWIGVCVATGSLLHLAADLVTKGPIPLSWPLPGRFSFNLIRTGSAVERGLSVVLTLAVVLLVYSQVTAL